MIVAFVFFFFFQAEDGIRDRNVTGVQTCALPIYSAQSIGRARRSRGGRAAGDAWDNAGTAGPLARLQRHSSHDHVSSCVSSSKSGPFGETQGLGRHAPGAGAARATDHRATAKLFSVGWAVHLNRPTH